MVEPEATLVKEEATFAPPTANSISVTAPKPETSCAALASPSLMRKVSKFVNVLLNTAEPSAANPQARK